MKIPATFRFFALAALTMLRSPPNLPFLFPVSVISYPPLVPITKK